MASTRVIAVANQKGGVGKSTTVLCLASSFAEMGRRVLVVDLDQQANATRTLGARSEGVATTYAILTGTIRDASAAIQHTRVERIDVVPGDLALVGIEAEMAGMRCRETILVDAMERVVAEGGYDYVLIDCSPSLGIMTTNALVAAHEVVIPILYDGYSLDGLGKLMMLVDAIRSNKRLNPDLTVSGIVVCQREPRQNLTASFDAQLPDVAAGYGTGVYNSRIRRCVKVREAQVTDRLLAEYAPGCSTAQDYEALAREIDRGESA